MPSGVQKAGMKQVFLPGCAGEVCLPQVLKIGTCEKIYELLLLLLEEEDSLNDTDFVV